MGLTGMKRMSLSEKRTIKKLLAEGKQAKEIAVDINRSYSAVCKAIRGFKSRSKTVVKGVRSKTIDQLISEYETKLKFLKELKSEL